MEDQQKNGAGESPSVAVQEQRRPNAESGAGRGGRRRVAKILFYLAALAVVLVVGAIAYRGAQHGLDISLLKREPAGGISSRVAIAPLGDGAFGVLSDLSAGSSSPQSRDAAGMAEQTSKVAEIAGTGGGGGMSGVGMPAIYPYQPIYYAYVYRGESFTQEEAKLQVLKRSEGGEKMAVSALSGVLDFQLFDLGKLGEAETASLSFVENRDYGYRTDIDLKRGSASIYKNWERWPNAVGSCEGEVCASPSALGSSDLIADAELIARCDAFLQNYAVDLSAYGSPVVNKQFWGVASAGQERYIPDEITVVYPLRVEEQDVYESYGEAVGLNVSYDLRNQRVSSVYNLLTHNYQSSAYAAVTDIDKILSAAENADGARPLAPEDGTAYETIELELDTPYRAYENLYRYENNQNAEYLVPCLVFPVKNQTEAGGYARTRVVVPLISDFMERDGGPVMIMKGAAGTATSPAPDVAAEPGAAN